MRIGIVGAGSIAFVVAAYLEKNGHKAILWSPSGKRTEEIAAGQTLTATGAVEGVFHPEAAKSAEDLVAKSEALVVALPGYGHKTVFDAISPHIRAGQAVIISSHASFGALYLSRALAARRVTVPIVAWGTTLGSGRQKSGTLVAVNTIRAKIDLATVPASMSKQGLELCQKLFGDRFVERKGLMAIALSNLNPQNHMGIALCNMTRMERGEAWSQGQNVTPNVGALLEALDTERLAIAKELGLNVRTIFEHFHLSFHVPVSSISQMNQEMHASGNGGTGPTTAESRYVLEDVPYGLVVTAMLGRMAGKPAKLHESGVAIFSAMYGRDFEASNELLNAMDFGKISLKELDALCATGFSS